MERGGETYYYHRDALGSITEVTDESGTLVERYEYDVYGAVTIFDGSGITLTTSAIENPYLFTARRYDPESGNYYYRARVYSPPLGRFLSQDPLGFDAGDYNLYRYVSNNPVNDVDPTGLQSGGDAMVIEWCQSNPIQCMLIAETVIFLGPLDVIVVVGGVAIVLTILSPPPVPPVVKPKPRPEPEVPPTICPPGGNGRIRPPLGNPLPQPEPPLQPRPEPFPGPDPLIPPLPVPAPTPTPEFERYLYHYTSDEGLIGILATQMIKVTTNDPEGWGDGQYFTDITPEDASVGSAHQLSRALFTTPWKFKSVTNWVKVNVADLPVRRVGPVFSRTTYGNKSIYLHPSQSPLNVAGRIAGSGPTPFSR
jgi:RHS repeat-associated protein